MSSNQYKNQNNGIKKGFSKTQQKFVPKGEQSNYNPTVSNSYRESISRQSGLAPEEDVGMSRINMKAEEGNRVSNNTQPGGKFVNYLPQDEAAAVGRGFEEGALDPEESQRVVDLLNRELGRLLKLKARHFWKEVAGDSSLHAFIESFLKYRGRWYDFPYREAKGTVAGVIIGEFELCRRVFMLLYRISSNRDPGAKSVDSLSPKDHAALLQEKKFLDLPKLLDICAIYGHENKDMTRLLITNSIKAQPWMHDEFLAFLSHVLSIIHTMSQRCSSSLEVLMPSIKLQDQLTNQSHSDYLEVMDFINDAVVTIDAFIDAYNPAAIFLSCPVEMSYGNEELLITLSRLHDSLLPSLRDGLRLILGSEDRGVDLVLETFTSLKLLSMRIVKLGWRLIYLCYLSDEAFENNCPFPSSMKMFPATIDDVVIRADILLQTLRDISQIHTDSIVGPGKDGSFLQNMEKDHNILSRIGLLQNTGWMSLDDQQYQFLSNILSYYHPLEVNKTDVPKLSSSDVRTGKNIQANEDTVILESKISQIKDLFPDYGKGYLAACLEAYDHNPEEVIQRILEQNLHEDLQALDISMEDLPERKTSKSYDKGKGKQPESEPSISSSVTSKSHDKGKGKQPESEPSNSSSVGRYTRKTDNDFMQSQVLDSRDKEYMLKNTALISSQLEYEDEYDDSFDELGLGVVDSGYDETEVTEASEDDNGRSNSSTNSKWGSRKTPQYYVKDGKNYSYKVEGGVAVANYKEATLVNESQKETIHGLGRGGNIPLGALKKMAEASKISEETELSEHGQGHGGVGRGNFRGRGRRGGGGRNAHNIDVNQSPPGGSNNDGNDEGDANEGEGGGGQGNFRGRGRRGGGGGGGRSHYRKDQAMKKHLSSLRG